MQSRLHVIPSGKSGETGHVAISNLPVQLNSPLGREREVKAVCVLLRHPAIRLLTPTGTGVGKTRVALQVVTELPR